MEGVKSSSLYVSLFNLLTWESSADANYVVQIKAEHHKVIDVGSTTPLQM